MWWSKQGCPRKSPGSNKNKAHRTKSRLSLGCIEMPTIQMKTKQNTLSLEERLTLETENSILQKVIVFSLEKTQITKGDYKEKEKETGRL